MAFILKYFFNIDIILNQIPLLKIIDNRKEFNFDKMLSYLSQFLTGTT